MLKTVTILMIAASVLGLACGTTGAVRAPALVELGVPARVVPVDRERQVHIAAVPERLGRVTAGPKAAQQKSGGWCLEVYGDGVRIRSTPDTSGAVLGLAYTHDLFKVVVGIVGPWTEGILMRSGVYGYVATEFLQGAFITC
jgi:hypothetical protein